MAAMSSIHGLRLLVSSTLVLAARKWRRTSHDILSAYNVSEACATPLLTANRLGEAVRQGTLAENVGIEGPSLVRLLDQLCAAGLMRREDDPADRRAKTIIVTDEGRAITAQMEADLLELRAQVLKDVSRDDLEATLRVLKAFVSYDAADASVEASPQTEAPQQQEQQKKQQDHRQKASGKASSKDNG